MLNVQHGVPEGLALLFAVVGGMVIGAVHGFFFAKVGVPAFVVTLAGLLGWNGLMLWVLGPTAPSTSPTTAWSRLTSNYFADVVAAVRAGGFGHRRVLPRFVRDARRRRAAGCPPGR